MTSWEERMADAAHAREAAEPRDAEGRTSDDPHYGHQTHLEMSSVMCSCGAFLGVTTVAAIAAPDKQDEQT